MRASPGIVPRRTALLAAVLATTAIGAGGALAGAMDALAYLLPVLLLLALVALRCYPGERVLVAALASRRRAPRACGAAGEPRRPRRARGPAALVARGGDLIGAALAVRPPPRVAAATAPAT